MHVPRTGNEVSERTVQVQCSFNCGGGPGSLSVAFLHVFILLDLIYAT